MKSNSPLKYVSKLDSSGINRFSPSKNGLRSENVKQTTNLYHPYSNLERVYLKSSMDSNKPIILCQ